MAKNQVDGVYDADPRGNSAARRYATLSYMDVLQQGLTVMDATAISLCMGRAMPIVVFDIFTAGNLQRLLGGDHVGTRIATDVETRFAD
jgi:uridylate kinase